MKRYNFVKTRPFMRGESAEGIAVHADDILSAWDKAEALLEKGESIIKFRDTRRCAVTCWHCDA